MEAELKALREEVARLRDEIAQLRFSGVNHHHYNHTAPAIYPTPLNPYQPMRPPPVWCGGQAIGIGWAAEAIQ